MAREISGLQQPQFALDSVLACVSRTAHCSRQAGKLGFSGMPLHNIFFAGVTGAAAGQYRSMQVYKNIKDARTRSGSGKRASAAETRDGVPMHKTMVCLSAEAALRVASINAAA